MGEDSRDRSSEYEYYIGLYFWRIAKDGTVGIYTRNHKGYHWDESKQFQSLGNIKDQDWVRKVSKEVLLDEANRDPIQVRDGKAMKSIEKHGLDPKKGILIERKEVNV